MSQDLTSRPLLGRLLRLVRDSPDGITASEASKMLGKHLASVYNGLSELRDRNLMTVKTSEDKRKTVFLIDTEAKRRRVAAILEDLKTARLPPQLANYVISDFEERVAKRLDKALPHCRVERSKIKDNTDIIIDCGKSVHGVEIKTTHNWSSQGDLLSGRLLRLVESNKFSTFFLVLLGKTEQAARTERIFERLEAITDFHVLEVDQLEVFQILPDEQKLDRIISDRVVSPILARLAKESS